MAQVLDKQHLEACVRSRRELGKQRRLLGGHAEALGDFVRARLCEIQPLFTGSADQAADRSGCQHRRPACVENAIRVIGRLAQCAVVLVLIQSSIEVLVLAAHEAGEGAGDQLDLRDRTEWRVARLVAEVTARVELVLRSHHASVVVLVAPVDNRVGDVGRHVRDLKEHGSRGGVDVDLGMLVLRAEEAHAVLHVADLPRARAEVAGRGQRQILEHLARVGGVGVLGVVLEDRDRLLDARPRGPARLDLRQRLAAHRRLPECQDLRRGNEHRRDGDSPDHEHDHGSAAQRACGARALQRLDPRAPPCWLEKPLFT